MTLEVKHLEPTYGIVDVLDYESSTMEFSTIGAEDSLEEAKSRLNDYDVLLVWGRENLLGVLTKEHLEKQGNCGEVCELDILVDPEPIKASLWKPKYVIVTDDGEPVMVSRGP